MSPEFRKGAVQSLPFILSVVPYGMIVGTLATNSGASFWETMLQSMLLFAGASQIVMWELYALGNPLWVIVLAVFAVNFRMVLYSAAIGRKLEPLSRPKMTMAMFVLQDISLAVGLKRAEHPGGLTLSFYMGLSLVLYIVWQVSTAVGIGFGTLIENPRDIGLDMLVPIYFLTLVMGFRAKPNAAIVFAVSAGVAAISFTLLGSPYHIALGGLSGMAVAALLARSAQVVEPARV